MNLYLLIVCRVIYGQNIQTLITGMLVVATEALESNTESSLRRYDFECGFAVTRDR